MKKIIALTLISFFSFCCSSDNDGSREIESTLEPVNLKILSLGDSYTIGQSVCETCRFPEQLKDSLLAQYPSSSNISLDIIATTGWTTTNLIDAINTSTLKNDYDLVTLLIGVNNQFQNKPFLLYEEEFLNY